MGLAPIGTTTPFTAHRPEFGSGQFGVQLGLELTPPDDLTGKVIHVIEFGKNLVFGIFRDDRSQLTTPRLVGVLGRGGERFGVEVCIACLLDGGGRMASI